MDVNSLRSFLWVCAFAGCVTYMALGWWLGHFFGWGYQASVIGFSLYGWHCFDQTELLLASIQQTIEYCVDDFLQEQQ